MASTTFVDQVTVIEASWLNDVNTATYGTVVNVLLNGIVADGTTDNTAALATMVAALPTYAVVYFPPGIYIGSMSVRRDNVMIVARGATLKLPAGSTAPIVLEFGNTPLGNGAPAYTNCGVIGLTVDGNKSNVTVPGDDLTGHGVALTNMSNSIIDVRAINCWNAGVLNVITSNFNRIRVYASNCATSGIGGAFACQINSSAHCKIEAQVESSGYGACMVDNCYDNQMEVCAKNITTVAVQCANQNVNQSYACNVKATIVGSGTDTGLALQTGFRNSVFDISARGCNIGVNMVAASPTSLNPTGNVLRVATQSTNLQSCIINGDANTWDITSYLDGLTGAPGSEFAIDVTGSYNVIRGVVRDGGTPQVRGIVFRAGAIENDASGFMAIGTVQALSDSGTRTKVGVVESPVAKLAYSTIPIGDVAYGSIGTSTTPVAGTIYWAEVFIDFLMNITGVKVLNAGTVGTNKWIVALYDNKGTLLANSALAGTLTAGANAFQSVAFTGAYVLNAPGRYWIAAQLDGTTDRFRTIAANTFVNVRTTSAVGAFGTLTALTVPSTFTADVGPVAMVY